MTPRLINILIGTATLVLVILISVQYYWVSNAIALEERAFTSTVQSVVREVIDELERQEAIDKLRSHESAKFLFLESDSLQNLPEDIPDSGLLHLTLKNVSKSNNNILTSRVHKNKRETKTIEKSIPKEKAREENLDVFNHDIEPDAIIPNEAFSESINAENTEKRIQGRIGNKKAFVGDIVRRLMEVNLDQDILQRLDIVKVDSVIKKKLKQKGVSTRLSVGIIDASGLLLHNSGSCDDSYLLNSLFKGELYPNDILPSRCMMSIYFPRKNTFLITKILGVLLISLLLVLTIAAFLYYMVNTIIKQKQLSDIKNDFINNMTHELKTPISTISLAHEALNDSDINTSKQLSDKYIGIIGKENKRLGGLVQNVLQHTLLENEAFAIDKEKHKLDQVIKEAIEKNQLQIEDKNAKLELELSVPNVIVELDQVHFINVISNLIDNALKYALTAPEIKVYTNQNKNGNVLVGVKDNGLGIKKEDQRYVFEKLYRVPTGNLHNIKGFGLGLSYVKTIIEKHGWTISLKSQIGKGSEFTILIPLENE